MAVDLKYGEVTFERGSIGEDEPVFILRAQDQQAPKALMAYVKLCLMAGSPREHIEDILDQLDLFHGWQDRNKFSVKVPDPLGGVRD